MIIPWFVHSQLGHPEPRAWCLAAAQPWPQRGSRRATMAPWRSVGLLSKPGSHHAYNFAAPIQGALWLRHEAGAGAAIARRASSMPTAGPGERQFTRAEKRRLF